MKVVFLCSNYEPGGAQRLIIKLEESFKDFGIDTQSWYLHRKYKNYSKDNPIIILNKKMKSPIDFTRCIRRLILRLIKEKPDAIYSSLPYANTLGLLIAWICGVKIRIASHHNESYNELNFLTKALDYVCAKLRVYTHIIAVSEPTKKSFAYYPKKIYDSIHVINNGIKYLNTNKTSEECRTFFGFDDKLFLIGAVGRLVEQKNHIYLIELLPYLKETSLVIVGKGDLKASLENRADELNVSEQLIIIDEVSTEKIPDFLKAIDIYLMPSLFEGLSVSLIEALHARLPIISSDIPSQKNVLFDITTGENYGLLVNLNNQEEWINKINLLKSNTTYYNQLSELAHRRSYDFQQEKMVNQYLNIIKGKR